MRTVEEMTERELLEELIVQKRREQTARRIKGGVCVLLLAVLTAALLRYLPPVIAYFQQLRETVEQVQENLQQLRNAADGITETVGGLRDAGQETLQDAVERLNELLGRLPGIFR